MLEAALRLAERGFYVFPIAVGRKTPPLVKWRSQSSRDPAQLGSWWAASPTANIGIDCGKSNLLVLDVDVKPGKPGIASLAGLEVEHAPLPRTLTVETPSGGMHFYFKSKDKLANTVDALGSGLDTRGFGGFVVAPGSAVGGKQYKLVSDNPIAVAPKWLVDRVASAQQPIEVTPVVVTEDFSRVIDYLKNGAAPAIEGQGGDALTYKTICRIKDMGVPDVKTAFALVLEHYNPRCKPLWTPEDLHRKCVAAYTYSQNSVGAKDPTNDFTPVEQTAEIAPQETPVSETLPQSAILESASLQPREWVLGRRLLRGAITLTVGAGGEGKSTLAILESVSVATGISVCGDVVERPGKVYYYNTEDPTDEIARRFHALCLHHNVNWPSVRDNIAVASGATRPLELAREQHGAVQLGKDLNRLENTIVEGGYSVVIIDPFVGAHNVSENDNRAIQRVTHALAQIAMKHKVAVNLVHHTRKGGVAGDMDSARGASALIAAARIAHTLSTMSLDDAKALGIPDDQRRLFLRLDAAKANFSAPVYEAKWYKKVGFRLLTGDDVGVLEPVEFAQEQKLAIASRLSEAYHIAAVLAPFLQSQGRSTLSACAEFMLEQTQLFEGFKKTYVMKKLESLFLQGVEHDGSIVRYSLEPTPAGKHWMALETVKEPWE